jgi:hypothetical protein
MDVYVYDQSTQMHDMSQEVMMFDRAQNVEDGYVGSKLISCVCMALDRTWQG